MAVFKFDKLKCPMSKVQSPKLKKSENNCQNICAIQLFFVPLQCCWKATKKSVQAIEKFLVGLPENFRWLHPLKHD